MAWKSLGIRIDYPRWKRLRQKILKERGRQCVKCKKIGGFLEIDHRIPVFKGGDFWDEDNLQILCKKCHRYKTYEENPKVGPLRKEWKKFLRETLKELG